jgi:hypothetical protein
MRKINADHTVEMIKILIRGHERMILKVEVSEENKLKFRSEIDGMKESIFMINNMVEID